MRRMIAVSMLFVVALAAGCTPSKPSPASTGSNGGAGSVVANTGAAATACAKLRTIIAADMSPLGKSLGTLVGRRTAGDSDDAADAEDDATAALRKLSTDLSATSASTSDPAVRSAAETAAKNITALADDPSFVSNIKSMDDIADATAKLQAAAAPIAAACEQT